MTLLMKRLSRWNGLRRIAARDGLAPQRTAPRRPAIAAARRGRASPRAASRWAAVAWLFVIPLINLFYSALNNGDRGAHSLVTDLDRALPFVPAFIIPYLLWYGYIFAGLIHLAFRDRVLYGRTLAALILTLLACYAVYYGYQTTVPRTVPTGDDALSRLIRWMQRQDAPYNCFPSIHIASSYLLLRAATNLWKGELPAYGARNDPAGR